MNVLRAQGMSLRQIGEDGGGMSHQTVKQRLRRGRVQKRDDNSISQRLSDRMPETGLQKRTSEVYSPTCLMLFVRCLDAKQHKTLPSEVRGRIQRRRREAASAIQHHQVVQIDVELARSFEALESAGLQINPTQIGPKEIDYLMTVGYEGGAEIGAGGSPYW